MTPEEKDTLLELLREFQDRAEREEKYEIADQMGAVRRQIRRWNGQGAFTHAAELEAWGIPLPKGMAVVGELLEEFDASDSHGKPVIGGLDWVEQENIPGKEALPPVDPDEALKSDFDVALNLLDGGRFHSARQQFRAVADQATGRLKEPAEQKYQEAQEKLSAETTRLVAIAQGTAGQDAEQQRRTWQEVLAADPDNSEARRVLGALGQSELAEKTRQEMAEIHGLAEQALSALRLRELNQAFGRATELREISQDPTLKWELDDLVGEITRQRDELRALLGSASTLSVSGNQREAYRQARTYLEQGVQVVYDQAGLLGAAGAEVDPYTFMRKARERFLAALRDLAGQRRDLAREQKGPTPELALETLKDAYGRLTDEILVKEDRDELQATLELVERDIQEVSKRLDNYKEARRLVLEAGVAGRGAEERYRLYQEAQQIYPEYPNLDDYLAQTFTAMAAEEAVLVQNAIALARGRKEQDAYDEARQILSHARQRAVIHIPQPRPGSSLAHSLADVVALEEEIAKAEADYHRLLGTLQEIDRLLDEHEQEKKTGSLAAARTRLEQLNEQERRHPQSGDRLVRLIGLQEISESWQQGRSAYQLGKWEEAVRFLEQVATSDVPESNMAGRLVQGARAAQAIAEARQAETGRRWGDALARYRQALEWLEEVDRDQQMDFLKQEAGQALERLKPLEVGDQVVRGQLNLAQALLLSANERVQQGRTSLLEKVEPIEEYHQAVALLLPIRNQPTTLTADIETTLRRVRQEWLTQYREGLRSASTSNDITILQKGIALGHALQQNELLYELSDQQLWNALREKYLDLEYKQLLDDPAADLERLEANRKEKLALAAVQTDILRQQYTEAIELRVRRQMGQERQKNLAAAVTFLKQEMQKPELYGHIGLFEELMGLLWDAGDWAEAQRQADGLSYRQIPHARELSQLWRSLTIAARLLEGGDLERYRSELNALYGPAQQFPEHLALWQRQQNWLTAWYVERLVRRAAELDQGGGDDKMIEAALLYAQAYQLNSQDNRVLTGLRVVGPRLIAGLETRLLQANSLALGRASLGQQIVEAIRLRKSLEDIVSVARPLGLTTQTEADVAEAVRRLNARIRPWQQVHALLESLEQERIKTLSLPVPFQPDQSDSGGWQLGDLQKRLQEIRQAAGRDQELLRLVNNHTTELMAIVNRATDLNDQVWKLLSAIEAEAFDQVMATADELDRLWRIRQNDGFMNLEDLLRYTYPFQRGEVQRPEDHKKLAQRQKNNFEQWQSWADKVQSRYGQVRKTAAPLKKKLDDMRLEYSLKDITTLCREVLALCNEFQDELDARPEAEPLSRLADGQKSQIADSWESEVLNEKTGYRGLASQRQEEAIEGLETLSTRNGPLQLLKGAMSQLELAASLVGKKTRRIGGREITTIPANKFTDAERYLKACQALDPLHVEVVESKKRINVLKQKYSGAQ